MCCTAAHTTCTALPPRAARLAHTHGLLQPMLQLPSHFKLKHRDSFVTAWASALMAARPPFRAVASALQGVLHPCPPLQVSLPSCLCSQLHALLIMNDTPILPCLHLCRAPPMCMHATPASPSCWITVTGTGGSHVHSRAAMSRSWISFLPSPPQLADVSGFLGAHVSPLGATWHSAAADICSHASCLLRLAGCRRVRSDVAG